MINLWRNAHARRWLIPAVIIAAGALAYANSFDGAFVYDGLASVVRDARAHTLAIEPGEIDGSGGQTSLTGRPVAMLTFALNYRISGKDVWSYHAVNLAIHLASALLLLGLVRRTLRLPRFEKIAAPHADALALVIALIWTIHPLQTGSVTYIIQRIEALMGCFYLLTLYAAARGFASPRPARCYALACAACLLGVGTKEAMVSAPLAVLLYDHTFVSPKIADALRRRWPFYLGLALTWVPLAWLVSLGARSDSVGFNVGVHWWTYLCTQAWAIVYYIRLTLWPAPLVLDYGMPDIGVTMLRAFHQYAPYGLVVALLLIGTVYAVARRSWLGFAGGVFFMVLAPSSSFVPIPTEVLAEHRMYLPLASLVALGVVAAHAGLQRFRIGAWAQLCLAAVVVVALGVTTAARNRDYVSYFHIWEDTARKRPGSARAHYNLGLGYVENEQMEPAIPRFERAIEIAPEYPDALNNLGAIYLSLSQPQRAAAYFERALRVLPMDGDITGNLALALMAMGDIRRSTIELERAVERGATDPDVHGYFGMVLLQRQEYDRAVAHLERAVAQTDVPHFYGNLGMEYLRRRNWPRAAWAFENVLRLRPDDIDAHAMLAIALAEQGRLAEAEELVARALRMEPGHERATKAMEVIRQRR